MTADLDALTREALNSDGPVSGEVENTSVMYRMVRHAIRFTLSRYAPHEFPAEPLKACAFCGSAPVGPGFADGRREPYVVACGSNACQVVGPRRRTPSEAWAAWNCRTREEDAKVAK